MNNTQKESAAAKATQSQNHLDYSVNDAILQALVGASEQAPVTAADLSWVTGLEERQVRLHVEALRREGNEICSNVNGYWIAKDKKDLDRFLAAYEAHAKSRLYTASRMRLHRQFEDDKERLERFREEWSNDPDNV